MATVFVLGGFDGAPHNALDARFSCNRVDAIPIGNARETGDKLLPVRSVVEGVWPSSLTCPVNQQGRRVRYEEAVRTDCCTVPQCPFDTAQSP